MQGWEHLPVAFGEREAKAFASMCFLGMLMSYLLTCQLSRSSSEQEGKVNTGMLILHAWVGVADDLGSTLLILHVWVGVCMSLTSTSHCSILVGLYNDKEPAGLSSRASPVMTQKYFTMSHFVAYTMPHFIAYNILCTPYLMKGTP
jgi:hypothetical protein